MHDLVRHWADWISNTAISNYFQDQSWIIPTSQSIHIICVCIVFGSATMISLRLLGVGAAGRSVSRLVDTLVPWMYGALVVLLLTGSIQTIAEPLRQFVTPAFWAKMIMIVIVLTLTIWFVHVLRANLKRWDTPARPAAAKLFALVSLGLWISIIACGRLIAYTWESHV